MQHINEPYIIGETAFHPEGDIEFLKGLIHAGEKLGLNALKFHLTLDLDDYMVQRHEAKEVLRPWCPNAAQWNEVLTEVKKCNIVLLCNDVKSIEYAQNCKFDIKAIEIHATGINDVFLLEKAAQFKNTVILGTGGSTLDEIDFAIQYLKEKGKTNVFLMHGFQNYPTDYEDIKLARMIKLKTLFDLPVGYADHTDPTNKYMPMISTLGLAAGFPVIEKHFTTHFGAKRIDAQSAVSLGQMQEVKEMATVVWKTLGEKNALELTVGEKKYANTGPMKKAIVARENIKKGTVIELRNIAYKRTPESSSLSQIDLKKIIGNTASKDIEKEALLNFSNLHYSFEINDMSQFKNTKK
jgi:sialic acid synthase SpsE